MASQTTLVDSLGRLVERVQHKARDYFPELQDVGDVYIKKTRHRAYSDMHFVVIHGVGVKSKELIVKVFPDAQLQFRAMTVVWPHFAGHPCWKIPKPLDYLADFNAFVMEAVDGVSVQARMPWIFYREQSLRMAEDDCYRAGRWLRFYHDLGRANDFAPLDIINKPDLEQTFDELSVERFDRNLSRQLASFLRTLAVRIADKPRPLSHVHGDFTADNVLVNQEHVTALDLWAQTRNTIDHDIASFLNSLLLLRLTRSVSQSAERRLRQAFLGGYFGQGHHDESPILFLQVMGLANVALEILKRRRSRLARVWVKHVVARSIGALAERLGECRS